ncbi:DUF3617 family protein [Sphingopyxis sp. KK2]|uniref:DUF3617 domain-containing protein n=1 Tax=Sphingopyxis sp. KK2 TaxID=1855727 RepID=UPI00097E70DD|nr:DUF3617 family protein [Sphingopyxis sp. KK2]
MKKTLMLAIASSLALAACGDKAAKDGESGKAASNEPPELRQPGSWSQEIEIVKLEGSEVKPEDKAKMQQMFSILSGMTVCVTPEVAKQEDLAKSLSDMGARGENCAFDKKVFSGKTVDFASTCKGDGGMTTKVTATGTSGATAQDITMTILANKEDGTKATEVVMRLTGERKGECGPNDIALPPPPAPAAKS